MESNFMISEVLKTSWKKLKGQIWVMAGLIVAYAIVYGILSMLLTPLQTSFVGGVLSSLIMILVSSAFMLGYYKNCFQTLDDEEPQFSAYGSQLKKIPAYFVASLLFSIMVGVGTVLLIIPGFYLALRFQFFFCFILEENAGPIESLKKSWQMTKGHGMPLFLLILTMIGIGILGIFCLIIGVFVAVPLVYIMQCYVYRKLALADDKQEGTVETI